MKKTVSIRTYLVLFCIGIVLASMLCQIVFNVFFARTLSIQQAKARIEDLYVQLVDGYSDDPSIINSISETALADENIKLIVLNENGEIIFDGAPMQSIPRNASSTFQISGNVSEKNILVQVVPDILPGHSVPPEIETDQTTVRLIESFEYQGERRIVIIWSSVVAIDSSVDLFTQSSIIVSGIVVFFGILLVLLFSNYLTKPIKNIEAVAKQMANLNFEQQADETVHAIELRSLARSVNTMSDELSTMIDSLSADNASLSSQVEYQEKMEQMRRQFIANISHEMKTPLSMLMMYSESLRSNVPGIDRDYYCSIIIEEAAGLNTMVGQLLDISSIENGLSQLNPQELSMSELTSSVLTRVSILLEDRKLIQDISPNITLQGDRKYLEQAMTNYISNAISHTQPDGTIRVSLTCQDDMACYSVFNDGLHIAEEDIPHLWDSFYRGDKSRTQSGQKRVGLGLYIVKTIIDAHGGSVAAQNVDNGVVFSFQIPLTTDD